MYNIMCTELYFKGDAKYFSKIFFLTTLLSLQPQNRNICIEGLREGTYFSLLCLSNGKMTAVSEYIHCLCTYLCKYRANQEENTNTNVKNLIWEP